MSDRSSPFDGIEELLDKLNRQLETAARSWEQSVDGGGQGRDRRQFNFSMDVGSGSTSLDIADEDEEFIVTVDVPGYEADDLDIRLAGELLTIEGEREHAEGHDDEERGVYIRREREVQSFSRKVTLPAAVDSDGVDATINNGILTIRLPKREPDSESHRIDID
ncbi:Hsp20-type molecular chaperone [Natrialba magadii ATCC 43099]|uniref:Heat shock protein Hsp20 n=1 Tax=Natrialba magadii (strain ATCC 43099 / DSM 3394 / CCM 3739 / CIP 104546 / IAM 13178 / JCM 8861 / NBRC 102185 / NCIMB 2190 / MS3) TaxID=547559 RepID=D3SYR9_NATMM|nr:Hsp20/alpha crystallin family protein [Natrialba magadii]ADD04180.2 Hsp20-type molecular chaperone [Natrialba magadii ATCC 43099]ELY32965.1 heat shock protein Hsp20 [Natrialba magadii ATCC 43099]